jgi:hypothetical protein
VNDLVGHVSDLQSLETRLFEILIPESALARISNVWGSEVAILTGRKNANAYLLVRQPIGDKSFLDHPPDSEAGQYDRPIEHVIRIVFETIVVGKRRGKAAAFQHHKSGRSQGQAGNRQIWTR